MKLPRNTTALALTALLAGCGTAGNKGKPVIAPIAPKSHYASLPTRTDAEIEALKSVKDDGLVSVSPNGKILQQAIDGTQVDLTATITGTYGPITQSRKFPNAKGTFFKRDGNLYVHNDGKVSLIAPQFDATTYVVVEDDVFYVQNKKESSSVKHLKRDGSGLEDILQFTESTIGDISVSTDGKKLICAQTPKMKGGPLSIFNNTDYLVVDIATGKYSPIDFKSQFGPYREPEGPSGVVLTKDGILFTFRNPGQKNHDLYEAVLEDTQLKNVKPVTFGEDVVSMTPTDSGIMYQTAAGAVYLKTNTATVLLTDSGFNGQPLYVGKK